MRKRTFSLSGAQANAGKPPFPVIVGAPRSGTTLLRLMLDSHHDLAIPPETGFLSVCGDFVSSGDSLREEFFQAVTDYPPGSSG